MLGDDAGEGLLGAQPIAHVEVGLAEREQQLGLPSRSGIAANGPLEPHGGRLGVIVLEVEARDVDLVVDEALQHLLAQLPRLGQVGRARVLLQEVVQLPLGVDHRRLILLVRRRQDPDVLGHVLDVALADLERDVAVLDLLVRGVQPGEALVAVDGLGVVAARELGVGQGQLGHDGELRERVLLFDELEILLRLGVVLVLELGQALFVVLLGGQRVGDRLALVVGARSP